jgi:glycosyltransferase involved in cell wall biosynthesis
MALRPFDISYYENFTQFEVLFVHSLKGKLRSEKVKFVRLTEKPAFFLDPVSIIRRKSSHVSWCYLNDLEKYLKNADVINTIETYFFISYQCAKIARKLRKPLVISVAQNLSNHFSKYVIPYSLNTRFVTENADMFVAMSERAKRYLLSLRIAEEKIKVLYPGIDTSVFSPPNNRNNDFPRILFVGDLTASKGILELLKACSLLWESGINFELWICGLGELESFVHLYSKRFPVKYFGFVSRKDIVRIYKQCDIFCLPSRDRRLFGLKIVTEQFGFVFLEAMASGLPIVSTNCGSITEVIGTENIIVNQGSIGQLYDALKDLLNDERKCRQMGTNNRKRAKNLFDARTQCNKLQNLIEKLNN